MKNFNYLLSNCDFFVFFTVVNYDIYPFPPRAWLSVLPVNSIQGSQQVALRLRIYGNRVDQSCVNNILRFASRCIKLCNSKATLLYEYLTLTFIFLDAHDDPDRRFFFFLSSSCSSIQFIRVPRNFEKLYFHKIGESYTSCITILNSCYCFIIYSKIVSSFTKKKKNMEKVFKVRKRQFFFFFLFFKEKISILQFEKYREIREKYN